MIDTIEAAMVENARLRAVLRSLRLNLDKRRDFDASWACEVSVKIIDWALEQGEGHDE